jgi:hypothetical protein
VWVANIESPQVAHSPVASPGWLGHSTPPATPSLSASAWSAPRTAAVGVCRQAQPWA